MDNQFLCGISILKDFSIPPRKVKDLNDLVKYEYVK